MDRPQAGALELTMSHEQKEYIPVSNRLRFAYNPEAQQIAVQEAQARGLLYEVARQVLPSKISKIAEAGLEWYVMWRNGGKLLSDDCDELLLRELKLHEGRVYNLTFIVGDHRPDVCFGRPDRVIAAVLTKDNRVVYRSPGFNLEAYKQEQSLNKEKEDEK